MSMARFYQDGSQVLWALVQCGNCQTVHKYSAANALQGEIRCPECGCATDVRDAIMKAASDWAELSSQNTRATRDFVSKSRAAARPGPGSRA